jgi:hypothetical protein
MWSGTALERPKGCLRFADLTDAELLELRHYIRQRAEADLAAVRKP